MAVRARIQLSIIFESTTMGEKTIHNPRDIFYLYKFCSSESGQDYQDMDAFHEIHNGEPARPSEFPWFEMPYIH